MSKKEKTIYIVLAIVAAILLFLLLFRKNPVVQQVLQDAGFSLPGITSPVIDIGDGPVLNIPGYIPRDSGSFPAVNFNSGLDDEGCTLCETTQVALTTPSPPKQMATVIPQKQLERLVYVPQNSSVGAVTGKDNRRPFCSAAGVCYPV